MYRQAGSLQPAHRQMPSMKAWASDAVLKVYFTMPEIVFSFSSLVRGLSSRKARAASRSQPTLTMCLLFIGLLGCDAWVERGVVGINLDADA